MMDDAERFVLWLSVTIIVLLLVVLGITLPAYQHPMPEKDCTTAFIYPICARAFTPEQNAPPSTIAVYFSLLFVALLAIILIIISYHASVIEQKALITGVAPPTATPTQGVDPKKLE